MTAERKKQIDKGAEIEKAMYLAMQVACGDPDAKRLGVAKAGGQWYKNYSTGQLYRVDKAVGRGYEVKEKKTNTVPKHIRLAVARKQKAEAKTKQSEARKEKKAEKKAAAGPTRLTLMMEAKDKGIKYFRILNREELEKVLANKDQKVIAKIIEEAKKRWKDCDFFKKKDKK